MPKLTSITQIKPTPALLLIGAGGAGKTTFALQFPKPGILNLDRNLAGPAEYLQSIKYPLDDISFEDLERTNFTAVGGKVSKDQIWAGFTKTFEDCMSKIKLLADSPDVETLIIDNTTLFNDVFINYLFAKHKIDQMRIQDWGEYLGLWKLLVTNLRATGKPIIFIGHTALDKNELTKEISTQLAVPGQAAHLIPTMFTDVWEISVESTKDAKGVVTSKRLVRAYSSKDFKGLKVSTTKIPSLWELTPTNTKTYINTLCQAA